ncbi:hypothetical protein HID58_048161 [Brassica napus]|uniref:Transposase-associated domain-containing protein n=1 Tax=Brassica napus TaxID=3708 RepID=A0ABQ8B1J4_BRANA|nr:hypothetical protein HID58_048161 [Brassica napus]
MDKSWINKQRLSQDYRLGVKHFLDFAFGKSKAPMVKCPSTRCSLAKFKTREDIEVHEEDMCVTGNARVPSDSAHVELDSTFNLLDDIFPDISTNMNEEHEEGSSGQPMDTDRQSASKRQQAHRHILVNCQLLDHLREKYKNELLTNRAIDIDREVHINFSEWIKQKSGGLLGSWLGQLRNDANLQPINYSDWRMVNPHIKNKVWEVIQSKLWFNDPPMRKVFVMNALGSRCKDVKLRLWKEYKRNSLSETLLNRPENVPENQWGHFVHMRFTEKWKEELTTLLGQKSHVTNNAIASLDDEYAQVFGPERPGRARVWASSFAVAFANILNPAFTNVPVPPNPNQEWSDDDVRD